MLLVEDHLDPFDNERDTAQNTIIWTDWDVKSPCSWRKQKVFNLFKTFICLMWDCLFLKGLSRTLKFILYKHLTVKCPSVGCKTTLRRLAIVGPWRSVMKIWFPWLLPLDAMHSDPLLYTQKQQKYKTK